MKAALVVLIAALALPAARAVGISFSITESLALSVGSASNSLRGSSNASSPGGGHAAGDFRVVAIAAADDADRARLALEPMPGNRSEAILLELPRRTLVQTPVAVGDVISAEPQPYGTQFTLAVTRQAFFLVLDDAWYRELAARRVRS